MKERTRAADGYFLSPPHIPSRYELRVVIYERVPSSPPPSRTPAGFVFVSDIPPPGFCLHPLLSLLQRHGRKSGSRPGNSYIQFKYWLANGYYTLPPARQQNHLPSLPNRLSVRPDLTATFPTQVAPTPFTNQDRRHFYRNS